MNPLKSLSEYGLSVWLDYIRRSLITSGELQRLVEEDGLAGVTSNPTIFEKAIAGSSDYDEQLKSLINEDIHMEPKRVFEKLAIEDIQLAAEVLRPLYNETGGADGFVSLELSPDLAYDTEGSVREAHRFWNEVDRPNLMLKVPATKEGIPVIERLISEGINVNITLMFSIAHYEAVANAYITGLEKCKDPSKVASVASFFISRVDNIVDNILEDIGTDDALELRGKIAIANAKIVYKKFRETFSGERWERLSSRGAKVQRVLWASTGTKNPEYSDVLYIEELIGRDTVNTMPPPTMDNFRDHGTVKNAIVEGIDAAEESLKVLKKLGVDLDSLTKKLQVDGAESFSKSYKKLIEAIREKIKDIIEGQVAKQVMNLGDYQKNIDRRLNEWADINFVRRLSQKDPTLWSKKVLPEIRNRLGWFSLPELMHDQLDNITSFANEVVGDGFKTVVLLGMGGSSLAPEVYQKTFGNEDGYPELIVLDSTHPNAVRDLEERVELGETLFIVASKSGTTLEPLSFFRYFYSKVAEIKSKPGENFIAITDPDTSLSTLSREKGFRKTFYAHPDLGGRYSALTMFGIVPAALIGVDVHRLLDRAWIVKEGCVSCVSEKENPGLYLGAALGELAKDGKNKVTFFTSPSLESFPYWLEQLIAESTGKDGKGIIPIAGEPQMNPEDYRRDRVFVSLSINNEKNPEIEKKMDLLEKIGHPTIRITLSESLDIAQEIFKWEFAIASAGSILGIHPFNQPDVELAKNLARDAMAKTFDTTVSIEGEIKVEDTDVLSKSIEEWISLSKGSDYVGIMAYLNPGLDTQVSLNRLREEVRLRLKVPTTLGFGPRFLHSTGQLHKGGPNTGLFLQIVDDPVIDIKVPETDYSFKDIIRAQSIGDFQALKQKKRRILRVNIQRNVLEGLDLIARLIRNQ